MASTILPLELIDKAIGSKIWVIMKTGTPSGVPVRLRYPLLHRLTLTRPQSASSLALSWDLTTMSVSSVRFGSRTSP